MYTHQTFLNDLIATQSTRPEQLLAYGFQLTATGDYRYQTTILDQQFTLTVLLTVDQQLTTQITDNTTELPYPPYQSEQATGPFVSQLRQAVRQQIEQLAASCFQTTIFSQPATLALLDYAHQQYANQPEFLWAKSPQNAVLRRRDSHKWYAAILVISKRKLGLDSDEIVEILDVRVDPAILPALIDNQRFFPAYHMNKTHWLTIILDQNTPLEMLEHYLDQSYQLAK